MIAKQLQKAFEYALNDAIQRRHEYVTLEHLLYALLHDRAVNKVIRECGGDIDELKKQLDDFLNRNLGNEGTGHVKGTGSLIHGDSQ